MTKERLHKLYDRFCGEERCKLLIAALARGDEKEAETLVDSCPRRTYRMQELAFTDSYKSSMVITIGLCLDLAPLLASLRMVEDLREIVPLMSELCENVAILAHVNGYEAGYSRAWKVAGKTGNPPGWQHGDEEGEDPTVEEDLEGITARLEEVSGWFIGSLQEQERYIASEALTIWQSFSDFCKGELLLEPEKLVQVWFEPMLPEIESLKNLSDLLKVNPERLKEYQATLTQVWSKLVRSN